MTNINKMVIHYYQYPRTVSTSDSTRFMKRITEQVSSILQLPHNIIHTPVIHTHTHVQTHIFRMVSVDSPEATDVFLFFFENHPVEMLMFSFSLELLLMLIMLLCG